MSHPHRGQPETAPATHRYFQWNGVHVALYAPWWAPSRRKREFGFMIRVRDPRALCQHRCQPAFLTPEVACCGSCGTRLRVKPRSLTIVTSAPIPRWRWLKVYIAKTRPERAAGKHGVVLMEAETHLTHGLSDRLTTKVFIRLKMGFGGRSV